MKSNYGFLNKLIKSFGYALSGLADLFKTEQNAKIHLAITILVISAGLIFKIAPIEWCIVLICIALVISTEALNTCIEKTIDYLFKEKNETARIVKDISAGAVLICAIISVICGLIIFLPKVLNLF
jgi:diacylglycerol kinase